MKNNRPTYQQVQYLIEFEKIGTVVGFQTKIADTFGIRQPNVNRFFRQCVEVGILTDKYKFTESGRAWLEKYKSHMRKLERYLKSAGVPDEMMDSAVASMVDNMDESVIDILVQDSGQSQLPKKRRDEIGESLRGSLQECDGNRIHFSIYKIDRSKSGRLLELSMAERGFEEDALLIGGDDSQYIQLTIREMRAVARVSGEEMTGHLKSLKYENDGRLIGVGIEDGKIRLPLSAFRLHVYSGGEIKGMLPITVTCTVGRTYMPESTALLVCWL
ncbi:MAG: hypothetical protein LUE92_03775 [Clostridiales bacterium]|nr:hypothetical protein [Clostridiales bacterium]